MSQRVEVLGDREALQGILEVDKVTPFQSIWGLREQTCFTNKGENSVRPYALIIVTLPGRFKRGDRVAYKMLHVDSDEPFRVLRPFNE